MLLLCLFSFLLPWVLVAACRISLVVVHRLLIAVAFLLADQRALGSMGFGSCATQAQLPWSMWNLPGPGIEPMSPALVGGFLITGPPGKSLNYSTLN